jgi:WD40 repeat protein
LPIAPKEEGAWVAEQSRADLQSLGETANATKRTVNFSHEEEIHAVFSLAWTSDQKKLISGVYNGLITIFDTATWHQIIILTEGHEGGIELEPPPCECIIG